MTLSAHLDLPLWTIELTLIASTAASSLEAKEALRGIKARRRKGDPMTCCCCPTTLGAAPFILVLGRGDEDAIPQVEAGLCRRCGPDLEAASARATEIVQAVWPGMAGYELEAVRNTQKLLLNRLDCSGPGLQDSCGDKARAYGRGSIGIYQASREAFRLEKLFPLT